MSGTHIWAIQIGEYPNCLDYTTQAVCEASNCHWCNGACQFEPCGGTCLENITKITCESAGCYWWSNGTCHNTPEPNPPPNYLPYILVGIGGIIVLAALLSRKKSTIYPPPKYYYPPPQYPPQYPYPSQKK